MLLLVSDFARLFPLTLLFPSSCGLHPGFVIFPKARIPRTGAMEAPGAVSVRFRFFEGSNITAFVQTLGWQVIIEVAVELDQLKGLCWEIAF